MKWLPWIDTTASDAFAREIADEFGHNCKPEILAADSPDARKRLAHATEVLGNRAAKFQREHRLGWIRKSRFMDTLQERLAELGYDDERVRTVLYAALMKAAR